MHSCENDIGNQWVNQDPLTISATQLRVRQLFEAALCSTSNHQQDCKCSTIKRYYGPRLFKCNLCGCESFRTGFESATERDRHVRAHERSYKCDRLKCEFSQIGFSSQASLNIHLEHHQDKKETFVVPQNHSNNHGDTKNFLLHAVENDDIELIRENLSEVPEFAQVLILAAVRSSSQMLELLLDACIELPESQFGFLSYAMREGNLEAARILIDRRVSMGWDARMIVGNLQGLSVDKIQLFLQYDLKGDRFHDHALDALASLSPSADEPEIEAKIIRCLGFLQPWTDENKKLKNKCYKKNAIHCFSIAIARFLLQNGVDVNYRSDGKDTNSQTALYRASGKRAQRAAEFMRFLLECGADPTLKRERDPPIADRPGPKNIGKWLGISWDQLVQESAKIYAASLPSAAENEHDIQEDEGVVMASPESFANSV